MFTTFRNWMIDCANIMFDDSKNDIRSLPKSVRLQILIVLSFVWTTVFSLCIQFNYFYMGLGRVSYGTCWINNRCVHYI